VVVTDGTSNTFRLGDYSIVSFDTPGLGYRVDDNAANINIARPGCSCAAVVARRAGELASQLTFVILIAATARP
jgi:hypothetical protein